MKSLRIPTVVAILLLPPAVYAQASASGDTKSPAFTDVYSVTFNKATLGQAAEVGRLMSQPTDSGPMANHFIVLRHQEGDDWDYCIISHVGPKASVEPAGAAPSRAYRELSAWHNDTYVAGPSWQEFTRQLGIGSETKPTTIYVVSVYRAAPGHRDQLLSALQGGTTAGVVTMQHLEGGPWTYLQVVRYNSWQDMGSDRSSNGNGWNQAREHFTYHHDTVADRIAPK